MVSFRRAFCQHRRQGLGEKVTAAKARHHGQGGQPAVRDRSAVDASQSDRHRDGLRQPQPAEDADHARGGRFGLRRGQPAADGLSVRGRDCWVRSWWSVPHGACFGVTG
jgi:hypothetical protein